MVKTKRIFAPEKRFLIVTISTHELLNIVDSMIMPMYSALRILAKRYVLVFAFDSELTQALQVIRKIHLQEGYVIANCGALIYSIEQKRTMKLSIIKTNQVYEIFRQAAIEFDSVLLLGIKENFDYGSEEHNLNYKISHVDKTIHSFNYDDAIKFIKTRKISSMQIFFNYFDKSTIEIRKRKIINLAIQYNLKITEITDGSLIITSSTVGQCINEILEIEKMPRLIYQTMLLTRIFDESHYIFVDDNTVIPEITIDDLYKSRTFNLFNVGLIRSIKNSNLLK